MNIIAEQRKSELKRFAEKYGLLEYEAKQLVNSYYRFKALEDRLLWLENEESTCNNDYTVQQRAKADRWFKRLNKQLRKYNLKLHWFSAFPVIVEIETGSQALYTFNYDKKCEGPCWVKK